GRASLWDVRTLRRAASRGRPGGRETDRRDSKAMAAPGASGLRQVIRAAGDRSAVRRARRSRRSRYRTARPPATSARDGAPVGNTTSAAAQRPGDSALGLRNARTGLADPGLRIAE